MSIPPDVLKKILAYYTFRSVCFFAWQCAEWALYALLLFSGASTKFFRRIQKAVRNSFLQTALFVFFVSAFLFVFMLPLLCYRGFVVEHQFGFSNENFISWIVRELKTFFVNTFFPVPLIYLGYFILRKSPRHWWWLCAALSVPILMAALVLVPVFIDPLFYTFTPVKNKALAAKILSVAEKSGISGSQIYEVNISKETKKVNAYVVGLFGTKRIVLWDTLLTWKEDEILFVLGHEMGHYKLNHLWYFVFGFPFLILVGMFFAHRILPRITTKYSTRFGFNDIRDTASYPLFALYFSVFLFVTLPVVNSFSRHFEAQADDFGLRVTKNPDAAIRVFNKFAIENYTHPDPPFFLHVFRDSHPSLKERIEMAGQFKESSRRH